MHGCSYELTPRKFIRKYRLNQRQHQLCIDNYRLPFWVVLRHFKTAMERLGRDEVESMALDALVRAARKFDPDRGFQFTTYATDVIRKNVARDIRQRGHFIRLPEAIFAKAKKAQREAAERRTRIISTAIFRNDRWQPARQEHMPAFDSEDLAGLERALRCLPQRARDIVQLRSQGMTLKAVGKQYGVTREAIRQIEMKALERLRRYYGLVDATERK